jgi:hypothetical protein
VNNIRSICCSIYKATSHAYILRTEKREVNPNYKEASGIDFEAVANHMEVVPVHLELHVLLLLPLVKQAEKRTMTATRVISHGPSMDLARILSAHNCTFSA